MTIRNPLTRPRLDSIPLRSIETSGSRIDVQPAKLAIREASYANQRLWKKQASGDLRLQGNGPWLGRL
jgi:hypothetical protein